MADEAPGAGGYVVLREAGPGSGWSWATSTGSRA